MDSVGSHTYADLHAAATRMGVVVTAATGGGTAGDGRQHRVAMLCPRDASYVVSMWGVWAAGGIAVPVAEGYPAEEVSYVLKDAGAWARGSGVVCR